MATIGTIAASATPTMTGRLRTAKHGDKSAPSIVFLVSLWLVVAFSVAALIALLLTAVTEGASRLDGNLFTQYASQIRPETGGARAAIFGSFW